MKAKHCKIEQLLFRIIRAAKKTNEHTLQRCRKNHYCSQNIKESKLKYFRDIPRRDGDRSVKTIV